MPSSARSARALSVVCWICGKRKPAGRTVRVGWFRGELTHRMFAGIQYRIDLWHRIRIGQVGICGLAPEDSPRDWRLFAASAIGN